MADEKPEPAPIRAFDRRGEKITVSKEEIGKLYALGGRVATKAEVSEHQLNQEYEQQSIPEKVLGYSKFISPVGSAAGAIYEGVTGKAPMALPEMEAYREGTGIGATAGLAQAAERSVRDYVGTSGPAYAERLTALKEAHPGLTAAGTAAGMVAGALSGSELAPAGAISKLGAAAEGVTADALSNVAARGALGKAAASAAGLGVRGVVEGGAFSGVEHAANILTQDPNNAAEKLFSLEGLTSWGKATGTGMLYGGLGGVALGGAGSLAASGARAVGERAGRLAESGLARIMAPAEEAASATAKGATEAIAEGRPLTQRINTGLKNLSNEMAFDALGATKVQARDALEHVEGGAKAVGEYVNRQIIGPASEGGAIGVGMNGRADDLLTAIQADKYGRIATNLSDSIKSTPARLNVAELESVGNRIYADMLKDPTKIAGAEAFGSRIKLESQALINAGKVTADGTMDAAEAFYVRADLAKQAYELGKASGAAGDAYKQYLREWDRATIRAIDQAAEKAGKTGVGDSIRHWKREWQLASAAEDAAQGGAEKFTRNNIFGLREGIGAATALASGHPLGAAATLIGGKIARERGAALAAYGLSQMAERGTLARWVAKVDGQIGQAAKGLVRPPAKGLPKPADRMPPTKALAKIALARVGEFNADPESYVDRTTRRMESVAAHSPEIASTIVQKHVTAMAFLASKVPVSPDPDPLDPHPAPKMTPGEEASLGRYWWYTEKPARFFSEVARGKLTYEGAEVAQTLAPTAFAELQAQTAEALTSALVKGERLPFRQRHALGVLLDFAATPSQRPDHAAFLQSNLQALDEPPPPTPPAPRRNVATPNQQRSSYDRLEAGGPGRS